MSQGSASASTRSVSNGGDSTRNVPPRWPAGAASADVHTEPSATAIALGRLWILIVFARRRVAGSIRVTAPSLSLVTHTPPAPTAIALGSRATGTTSVTWFVAGSMR